MSANVYDVIIIGGGAAGLACAVGLFNGGKKLKIKIIEAGERFGKKLAATGNGQGNISNTEMTANRFHGGNTALVEKIACADVYAGAKLFGCLFTADEKGRIYPAGKQASSLTDSLLNTLNGFDGDCLANGEKVLKINKNDNGFSIQTDKGAYNCKYAVLCTGGKAQKQFKTDGSSYALATNLGHTLTPLYPSIVQLKTDTVHIKTLKGIRADCSVSAVCEGKVLFCSRGDVIFTEYGVSGNAVFSVSSYVADKHNVKLKIEFLPDFSEKEVEESVASAIKSGRRTEELLSGSLHNQIGRAVIKRAASTSAKDIARAVKNFTLDVTGTLGFDYAQVTKGGINMTEITDELESKIVKNLFFAGEILDVDGDCGGYNLQWAFTSGLAAAESILKRVGI